MKIDWKKKYEEALNKARELHGTVAAGRDFLAEIFPELCESEDERIRKELLAVINDLILPDEQRTRFNAWLEKQKEQKPVEKQDYSGLNDLERAILRGFLAAGMENVPVGIIKETAQECLAQMKSLWWSKEDKRKLNRIYAILGQAADTHAYSTTCRLIGDKEAVELQDFLRSIAKPQIPEWSDEDELMRTAVIQTLETLGGRGTTGMQIDWLKSLRPQPKQEWSEEDKQWLDDAIYFLESAKSHYADPYEIEATIVWLKSLKNRGNFPESNTNSPWKPSARQLMALDGVKMRMSLEGYGLCPDLQSLLDDIKKLM